MANMEQVALQRWARLLLLGHAGFSIALVGSSTHLLVIALKLFWRRFAKARLLRIHAQTTSLLYVATFVWGLLMYPTYRYYVRGLYLDRYAPWASNLFDMKENLAALGLPAALVLFAVTRRLDPRTQPNAIPIVVVLALIIWMAVMFSIVGGLLVTCVKGV